MLLNLYPGFVMSWKILKKSLEMHIMDTPELTNQQLMKLQSVVVAVVAIVADVVLDW